MDFFIAAGLIFCSDEVMAKLKTDINCLPNNRIITENVQFLLYTSSNPHVPHFLRPYEDDTLRNSNFAFNFPTILFIHGFTESALKAAAQTIAEKFLNKGDYNIILVNWKNFARPPNYCYAIEKLPLVAKETVRLLLWLNGEKNNFLPSLHLIGFSLGAHISALIGYQIQDVIGQKIGRITALDPAGPAFDMNSHLNARLDPTDATLVDVIHTNTERYGIELPLGHIDFYVNGGKTQPGCKWIPACSHSRAWMYFAESILNTKGFLAAKCANFHLEQCDRSDNNFMGLAIKPENVGVFKVNTRFESPFALYRQGLL